MSARVIAGTGVGDGDRDGLGLRVAVTLGEEVRAPLASSSDASPHASEIAIKTAEMAINARLRVVRLLKTEN